MQEKESRRDEGQQKRLPPQFYAFLKQRLSTAAPKAEAELKKNNLEEVPQHVETSRSPIGSEEYEDSYAAADDVEVSSAESSAVDQRKGEHDIIIAHEGSEEEVEEEEDIVEEQYTATFSLRKQIDARLTLLRRDPDADSPSQDRSESGAVDQQNYYPGSSPAGAAVPEEKYQPITAARRSRSEDAESAHIGSAASVRSMLSVLRRITDTCADDAFGSHRADYIGSERSVGGHGGKRDANAMREIAPQRKEEEAKVLHRIPHAPPLNSRSIPSLSFIIKSVWFEIGLFNFKPVSLASSANDISASATRQEENNNRVREVDLLIASLERYLTVCTGDDDGNGLSVRSRDPSSPQEKGVQKDASSPLPLRSLRNALWLLLHNTVYYCVAVLADGAHNSDYNSNKHAEYRSGGAEDDFEVVFSSSSSSSESSSADPNRNDGARRVPTKLSWSTGANGGRSQFRRRQRPFTRESNHPHDAEAETAAALAKPSNARRQEFLRSRRDALEPFHGRLATPLTQTEWYFVIRCMAEMGYPRQSFYLCTPMRASLCELLVAMLWLTKRHCLVSVAEFLVLQERFPFLLANTSTASSIDKDDADGEKKVGEPGVPHTYAALSMRERRLLAQFPAAVPWPPSTFEEEQRVAQRLAQLDQLASGATGPPNGSEPVGSRVPPAASRASAYLLALRRLTSISLNRMDVALQRRAEQTVLLGLHSALDAEMCLPENNAAYTALLQGLEYVATTEERVAATTRELSKLGSILATAVRIERITDAARAYSAGLTSPHSDVDPLLLPPLRIEDVLEAMRDDDQTWLDRDGEPAERANSGNLVLGDAVRQFKATRTLELLTERWRSMVRRARARAVSTPSRPDRHGQRTLHPILLDEEAQREQDEVVAVNVSSRYSLEAALAAEWIALQIEETERSWRAAVTSGGNGSTGDDETPDRSERRGQCNVALHPHLPFELTFDPARVSSRCTPQRTEVGIPPSGTSTSTRLAISQLEAATAQLEDVEATRVQNDLEIGYALHDELTRLGLRVVNRRRGRRQTQ